MNSNKIILCFLLLQLWTSCKTKPAVTEDDKIFHAGPVDDGFGVIYWGLYNDYKYQFCDGNFMNPGCYTGFYSLSGDTITLKELKHHDGISTNRFLVRRYKNMDSTYWQWKYPEHKDDWRRMQDRDTGIGSSGDIFPLDSKGKIVYNRNNYFLIRFDKIENVH